MKKQKKKPDSNNRIIRLFKALGIIAASLLLTDVEFNRDEHPMLAIFSQIFTYGPILLFAIVFVGSLLGYW